LPAVGSNCDTSLSLTIQAQWCNKHNYWA